MGWGALGEGDEVHEDKDGGVGGADDGDGGGRVTWEELGEQGWFESVVEVERGGELGGCGRN